MGIDLRLEFKTKREFTEEGLSDFDYRFNEANNEFGKVRPLEDSGRYEICTSHRYYGKGYTCGPFNEIYAAIKWLQFNIPDIEIYYGGDCSDELILLDKNEEQELFELWAKDGGVEYSQGFNFIAGCEAPFCENHPTRTMAAHTFSQQETTYKCLACNYEKTINKI